MGTVGNNHPTVLHQAHADASGSVGVFPEVFGTGKVPDSHPLNHLGQLLGDREPFSPKDLARLGLNIPVALQ